MINIPIDKLGIGAVIHNWIPESWIQNILGSRNPLGVILAVIVGVPMYADIFGTIPVAEALLLRHTRRGYLLYQDPGCWLQVLPRAGRERNGCCKGNGAEH